MIRKLILYLSIMILEMGGLSAAITISDNFPGPSLSNLWYTWYDINDAGSVHTFKIVNGSLEMEISGGIYMDEGIVLNQVVNLDKKETKIRLDLKIFSATSSPASIFVELDCGNFTNKPHNGTNPFVQFIVNKNEKIRLGAANAANDSLFEITLPSPPSNLPAIADSLSTYELVFRATSDPKVYILLFNWMRANNITDTIYSAFGTVNFGSVDPMKLNVAVTVQFFGEAQHCIGAVDNFVVEQNTITLNTPPTVTVNQTDDTLNYTGQYIISGTVTDADGVTWAQLDLNGIIYPLTLGDNGVYSINIPLAHGVNTIEVKAENIHHIQAADVIKIYTPLKSINSYIVPSYPRLATYYLGPLPSDSNLYKYDVIVTQVGDAGNHKMIGYVKSKNPNALVLGYTREVMFIGADPVNDAWRLKDGSGNYIEVPPGDPYAGRKLWDWSIDCPKINGKRYIDYLVDWTFDNVINVGVYDGVFYDVFWETPWPTNTPYSQAHPWEKFLEGQEELARMVRQRLLAEGKNQIVTFNGMAEEYNGNSYPGYDVHPWANGELFEEFPGDIHGFANPNNPTNVSRAMIRYLRAADPANGFVQPRMNIVTGWGEYFRWPDQCRVQMCLALMGDAFFHYHPNAALGHAGPLHWYDEFDNGNKGLHYLGQPVSPPMQVGGNSQNYYREFENGWAFVNFSDFTLSFPVPSAGLWTIQGVTDPLDNDGSQVTSLTLDPFRAKILLKKQSIPIAVRSAGLNFNKGLNIFPNPFHIHTTIQYAVPMQQSLRLSVYDLEGRVVKILKAGLHPQGDFSAHWDARDELGQSVANGVYLTKLESLAGSKQTSITRKFLLIK